MNLVEQKNHFLIEGFFPDTVVAGFTKPSIAGREVEKDIISVLASHTASYRRVAFMRQLHSSTVNVIYKEGIYEGDALFTTKKGIALVVKSADCLPLFFYDQKTGAVGAVHMGWRSAKEGIIDNISIDLSCAMALAGVAMRQCCFEVGSEFLDFNNLSAHLLRRGDKLYFDPVGFSKSSLISAGMKEANFADVGMCTVCHGARFFSYRRDKTGDRMLSFIIKK